MIFLTRMDKQHFFINPDHIVCIEETPDTVITLFNDHRFIVTDSARDIINKIIAYRAKILRRAGNTVSKKYLDRTNIKRFNNYTLNSSINPLVTSGNKRRTPFHGLEL